MRSMPVLRAVFCICCLSIGIVFLIAASRNDRNYGRLELLIAGESADASADDFRDKLSDGILETLQKGSGPKEVLVLNGLGKRTSFWVGLSNANSQQFFERPMGGSAKRVIVRSTDEHRSIVGSLATPIGLGCGLSETPQSDLMQLEPGEVSRVEPCTGAYHESEGITNFVDVVAVPLATRCDSHEEACIQRHTRKVIGHLFEKTRYSRLQLDSLIIPAISTGFGGQGPDIFYTSFANTYTDHVLENLAIFSNIIFPVFVRDWNTKFGDTSLSEDAGEKRTIDEGLLIQSSLTNCLQKIAVAWKQQADVQIAVEKARRDFLSVLAGIFLGLAVVPLAFSDFFNVRSPIFGVTALFGYLFLSFAIAKGLQDLLEKLSITHSVASTTLLGILSVPLFYIVHRAEEAAKDGLETGQHSSTSTTSPSRHEQIHS